MAAMDKTLFAKQSKTKQNKKRVKREAASLLRSARDNAVILSYDN